MIKYLKHISCNLYQCPIQNSPCLKNKATETQRSVFFTLSNCQKGAIDYAQSKIAFRLQGS